MKIIVASDNPAKINTVKRGYEKVFYSEELNIQGISVPSNVSSQPRSEDEALRGAMYRVFNAKLMCMNADYWVGIEGGIMDEDNVMRCFAWVVVLSKSERIGKSRTADLEIPPRVAMLVRQGKELVEADDIVFNKKNSKQFDGAIGLLTHNIIDRTAFFEHALILALTPFANPELYMSKSIHCADITN